jgi:hypothetical protein
LKFLFAGQYTISKMFEKRFLLTRKRVAIPSALFGMALTRPTVHGASRSNVTVGKIGF